MTKLKADLATAEKEASQYKLAFLKEQEKKQDSEHGEDDKVYKNNEKEMNKHKHFHHAQKDALEEEVLGKEDSEEKKPRHKKKATKKSKKSKRSDDGEEGDADEEDTELLHRVDHH